MFVKKKKKIVQCQKMQVFVSLPAMYGISINIAETK